ncbi:hypothetical protein C8A00DRAFT_19406 [Chaetomidium leptoderma]|uniref:Uncharacterized protein n=1 Tax=Chaetomidium leptoderma TaxID=669021 RepID=A0AAN6ZSQ2_9PEZI|nr:hypothetical protein C8A00DRAFT_19406 [Chaetomidium leptoderma]
MANLDFDISQWYNEDDLDYRTPDPPVFDSRGTSPAHTNQPQRGGPGLPLLQLADWDPNLPYDESPPTCIHYSIEWKLLLKKGRLSKLTNDTEQNLVLAPGAFWDQTLKSKLQQLLTKKMPRNKCYEPDETNVVVSVTDRSQRDLTKRFDELEIDWEVVEDQLMAWSHLLRDGKRLRIDISVIYKEANQPVAVRTQQITRRGGVTAIQLAERAELLEEQEASGLTTVWKEVYTLMRCTGPPCQGTYCWRDPDNRKHYKLDTSVLTKLVDYAEEGNTLRTHGDVPPWIRELIYAKDQQDSERRKRKRQASVSESLPPIHITNVLRARCNQDSAGCSTVSAPETREEARIRYTTQLDIPQPIDKSLHRYCEWLCARVTDPVWKDGYRVARKIALEEGLDLERLFSAQDVETKSLIEKGVKRGIAIQFVSKVKAWLEEVEA